MANGQSFFKTVEHVDADAERRIGRMGLSLSGFVTSIDRGEQARAQVTKHDPKTSGGQNAWQHRVRSLRDIFCLPPFLWLPDTDRGLELIVSPCGRRSIITRAGDRHVGIPGTHPQPKSEVGEMTARRVIGNASLFLEPNWMNVAKVAAAASSRELWLLLVRRGEDREQDVVFSEISLPSTIGEDGQVDGWIERIILPPRDLTNPGNKERPADPFEVADVPMTRKRQS